MCEFNANYRQCIVHGGCNENGIPCKHLPPVPYPQSMHILNMDICRECNRDTCNYEKGIYITDYQI